MAKPNGTEQEVKHPKWMNKNLDYDPFQTKYGESLKLSDEVSFYPQDYSLEQIKSIYLRCKALLGRFRCSTCEICFPTKYSFNKHIRDNHQTKSKDLLLVCPKCEQHFSTKSYAQTHISENKCDDKLSEIICPSKRCREKFSDKRKRDKFNAHYLKDHKEEAPIECKQLRFCCASCSWSNNVFSNAGYHTCKGDKSKTLVIDVDNKLVIKRGNIRCSEAVLSSDVQLSHIANRTRCTPSDYFFKRSLECPVRDIEDKKSSAE